MVKNIKPGKPDAAPGAETAPTPTSNRKKRYSFYDDAKDYVLLAVQADPQTGEPVPNGSLTAIPETPRFESAVEAERWVSQSGEKLAGLRVLVIKMIASIRVLVENKPTITVTKDPRFAKDMADTAAVSADVVTTPEPAAATA